MKVQNTGTLIRSGLKRDNMTWYLALLPVQVKLVLTDGHDPDGFDQ